MTQRTKQIIIASVIIIIAFIGFKMFFPSGSGDTTLLTDQVSATEFTDGQTILVLLDKLNRVTLDDTIFSNKVFVSLVSFEKPIADQVIGRPNPFLPIGFDGSGVIIPQGSSTVRSR